MKNLTLFFTLLFLAATGAGAQSSQVVKEYIEKFKSIAIEEMLRTGVPAAITLAQGIHETGAGTSDLVRKSNNHFGIKCKTEWQGEKVYHDDDARGECFRKYNDPMQSYKDHSDFLKNRPYYTSLFSLDPTDYEAWAHGLKKAGYATNPKYAQILIKLINDYRLQDYSLMALGRLSRDNNAAVTAEAKPQLPASNYPSGVFRINGTRVVYIQKGTSYLALADEYRISLPRLFEFNDMRPAEEAQQAELLFLGRKRKEGATETHVVQPGETLRSIAQTEGVRLESLIAYNYLREGVEPPAGRSLYLRGAETKSLKDIFSGASIFKKKEEPKAEKEIADVYLVHTVQPKETLYSIAKKYNVTVSGIKEWNSLQSSVLTRGQQLRINKTTYGTN